MISTIINLLEIYVVVKILYKTSRFFFGKSGKYKKGKSIAGKIGFLLSNRIHYSLDGRIKRQKKRTASPQSPNNVVQFQRRKA